MSPDGGDVSPAGGDMSPDCGDISPAGGDMSPNEGDIHINTIVQQLIDRHPRSLHCLRNAWFHFFINVYVKHVEGTM
jgi:hypothetical protein